MTAPPLAELAGRLAVVTGSSSGIGRAIALELAAAGADVVVHCRRRREAAQRTADEIRATGRRAFVLEADLADPDARQRLVEEAERQAGPVDVWVNNAGVDVLTGDARRLSFAEKLDRLWHVDVVATMELTRAIGLRMKEHRQSRPSDDFRPAIVNIGWDQVEYGMGGDSGEMFSAIKGAVMAFTRSAARSLAPEVRVNCAAPGWIRTAWGDQASDYWQRRAVSESLLQRWGEPADVARAVRFLASPASAFVTGATLPVNGGYKGAAG